MNQTDKQTQIFIASPEWEITTEISIILKGRDTNIDHATEVCDPDKDMDFEIINGTSTNGTDSGTFFGICGNLIGHHKLTINACGGKVWDQQNETSPKKKDGKNLLKYIRTKIDKSVSAIGKKIGLGPQHGKNGEIKMISLLKYDNIVICNNEDDMVEINNPLGSFQMYKKWAIFASTQDIKEKYIHKFIRDVIIQIY